MSDGGDLGAPDYAEPRIGWRVWTVVEADGTLRLCSLVYRTIWRPGEEAVARCRRPLAALPWTRLPLHGPPDHDCYCGIHAVRTPERAALYLSAPLGRDVGAIARVIGEVALWGRVIEAEHGWRAGRGYPERLYLPEPRRRRVARGGGGLRLAAVARALEAYGVPVDVGPCETPAPSLERVT